MTINKDLVNGNFEILVYIDNINSIYYTSMFQLKDLSLLDS